MLRSNWFMPILLLIGISDQAFAAGRLVVHELPVTPYVGKQVKFWEQIFSKYTSDQVLIHDSWNPEIIIDMIDFRTFSAKYKGGRPYTREAKNRLTQRYLARYRKAIKRFQNEGRKAARHGAIEERVYSVYAKNLRALSELYRGKIDIRSQSGLSNDFAQAAKIAEKYLPYMEKIFNREGISSDLTRIAFVESMFNLNAKSKVGASGIWQFMPSTAKHYLRLNRIIDERHSPLKATVAAARFLKENHQALESWPLAITAYNHGRSGMARAQRQLKTSNLDQIILRYEHRMFGFASRNFYAEFLAARNIYNRFYRPKRSHNDNPLSITMIRLKEPLSLSQIIEHTKLSIDTIKKNNPDFKKSAFTTYRNTPLPLNYELIIPQSHESHIRKALNGLFSARGRDNKRWRRL